MIRAARGRRSPVCLAVMLVAAYSATLTAEVKRPGFSFLRQNEDWSVLSSESKLEGWDRIKYVPVGADGAIWASFGGTFRLRIEDWSNFGFGAAAANDDTFSLGRVLAHADVHFGKYARAFVEGKSAVSEGRSLPGGTRTLDQDSLDLQQGFIDLSIPFSGSGSVTVRTGRMALQFGQQKLVSPLPWANTLRSWDGADVIVRSGVWTIDTFWTQFAPVRSYEFNEPDDGTRFWGAYAARKGKRFALDLYGLGLERDDPVVFNGTTGAEERYTIGARVNVSWKPVDLEAEGAWQFGSVGSGDVSAAMLSVEIGHRFETWSWQPRFQLGLDYASGDREAGGDVETFNQLFPLGHAYFGSMDFVGRQNIEDVSPSVQLSPMKKMSWTIAFHEFRLAEEADALYNAGGGVVRPGSSGGSRDVGNEIDSVLGYRFTGHLLGEVGFGLFSPGEFIEETGAAEDMEFAYVQVEYRF